VAIAVNSAVPGLLLKRASHDILRSFALLSYGDAINLKVSAVRYTDTIGLAVKVWGSVALVTISVR